MRRLFLFFFCLVLSACASDESVRRDQSYATDYAHFERVGAWAITCTAYLQRPDGTIRPYNSCSLRRSLPRGSLDGGNALVITAVNGHETIVAPQGDSRCRKQPSARLVDNAFVRDWPMSRQIEALKTGSRYSEEFMPRKSPECWIVVRYASLDGFPRAYRRFEEVARARRILW